MPLTIRRRLVDRIRQWRKTVYVVCVGFVILAGGVVFLSVSSPASSVELASGPTFFDSSRAFRAADDMLKYYPDRILGSPDSRDVVNWVVEKLPDPDRATIDEFQTPMGNTEVTVRNVAVVLQGTNKETIVVAAPRDIPVPAESEPLAYASGTAMLLDLVQVFADRPHQKTLVFLSTEDNSTGGVGIDRFLQESELAENVSTILSIHGLGKERTTSLAAGVTGSQGTTPGWYVQLVSRVLANTGLNLNVPGLLSRPPTTLCRCRRATRWQGGAEASPLSGCMTTETASPTAAGMATRAPPFERLILSIDSGTLGPVRPGDRSIAEIGALSHQAGCDLSGRAHAVTHFRGVLDLALLFTYQWDGGAPAPTQSCFVCAPGWGPVSAHVHTVASGAGSRSTVSKTDD